MLRRTAESEGLAQLELLLGAGTGSSLREAALDAARDSEPPVGPYIGVVPWLSRITRSCSPGLYSVS
ncbi:hypothetical protein NDU88_008113 [Pleurodeles waltl]|uniref:Uncharacterized protein n=1 Tax=Pleurodeles waltl TaxID=8319 RepID=A0AAV7U3I2_PLEWA|nr:hypothetical protein NDU88_008113 [Pleurodeles waltl]